MVRKSALAALVAASVLLPPVAAPAGFQGGYAYWTAMSPAARMVGYVMGAVDRIMSKPGQSDEGAQVAWIVALPTCLGDRLNARAGMIEGAVTDAYRANPDLWSTSPVEMINYVVVRLCEPELAFRLKQQGLPPESADRVLAGMKALEKLLAEERARSGGKAERPAPPWSP